jgi:AcrR family transcriptional regulator
MSAPSPRGSSRRTPETTAKAREEQAAEISSRFRRRRDVTREKLLDAALALFGERGYEAVTLGEITSRADVGTGTLYLHFKDKRHLYEGLARRTLAEMGERWLAMASEVSDPREQVVLMVRVAVELIAEDPRQAGLFLCEGPAVETWLVEEVAAGIASVLEGHVAEPELQAHLVIGVALAAGRAYLLSAKRTKTEALIASAVDFCRDGLRAPASARPVRRGARTARRSR